MSKNRKKTQCFDIYKQKKKRFYVYKMVIYTKWSSISQSQWWNLVNYNIDDATNQYVTWHRMGRKPFMILTTFKIQMLTDFEV